MSKMFVHVAKKSTFTSELQEQYNNSIVFIKDSQEIYTHGTFYAIPDSYKDKITSLETAVAALQETPAFSKVSDGANVAEAPSRNGILKFNAGANVTVAVGADGVTIGATDTTYTSGTGITVSGTTINHSNLVTAKSAGEAADKTLTFGGTFSIPYVDYDAQGHIKSTTKGITLTMPAAPTFTNWQAKNIVGASATATVNAATTNTTTFLNLIENGAVRSSHQITGTGKVTVTADATGKVTINGAATTAASGSANGTIAIDGTDVAVKGLASAAYKDIDAFASKAVGDASTAHIADKANPHGVTKAQIGLDKVENMTTAEILASDVETIAAGVSGSKIANTEFVIREIGNKIQAAQALRFKGTVGTGGTVATLPTTGVQIGDTYIVKAAGNFAGEGCEAGDMIVAVATTPTWQVIQRNLDGAVTGKSLTANALILGNGDSTVKALANGGNGKILKMVSGTPSWADEYSYTLPSATDTVLGGIKTGYTANGKNYPVDLDTNNKAFVNVPWTDNNTTYTFASGSAGNFTVTPSGGNAQTVSIGTPATAGKVANALTISLNGTAQTAFNGSAAVSFNITPGSIGAAAASHNQASDTINAMTNYIKPLDTGAIAAGDSLNVAIGKLEAAWDWVEL